VALGYFRDPEATARSFHGGRFHTGDLAAVDQDGFIFVVGREAVFIKTAGHRIAPHEIEAVLGAHPAVAEAAVFGAPDPLRGEAVSAVVVAVAGTTLDRAALKEWCRARLPAFMVPTRIDAVAALPRTANGKIARRELGRG